MVGANRQSGVGPSVTRVGLIGDVHTERVRLEGALRHLRALSPDRLLCTGDLPDGPLDAHEVDACCELLRAAKVLTICGNHDRWVQDGEMRDLPGATEREELAAATLAFLAALPATLELATPAGAALLCHGMGADDMAGVQPYDHGLALSENDALQTLLREKHFRYVLAGHTHRPMVRTISGVTLVNAGTLLTGQTPCCAFIDFERRHLVYFDVAENGSVRASSEWSL